MGNGKLQIQLRDMLLLALLTLAMALPGLAKLPVIDRDEARYAQASVQMIETGDYVNIRFQDQARNKKPAGSYWLQAASVKLFSDVKDRKIWPHRLPSVLAALLAVLATYWGGRRLLGREAAMIGSSLLAVSMIFVFEAHIAKTDALLCGFSAVVLATIAYLRNGGGKRSAILFWAALGCAVMIKGPILPLLLVLCICCLILWERDTKWLKPLLFWPGPLLFLLVVLPWMLLIWRETGGAFFTDAIGGDLAPKLKGGHETHGGPPGYHSLLTWAIFWPSCLFLLPGIAFALRAAFQKDQKQSAVSKSARLLLCWTVPFFIVFELVPTKLPHYTLPIYPALALMASAAVITLTKVEEFPVLRRINAVIFAVVSIALICGLLFGESFYGDDPSWSFAVMGTALLICLFASARMWAAKGQSAFIGVLFAALLVNIPTYQFTLPSLDALLVSRNVKSTMSNLGVSFPIANTTKIVSPQFTEPSLVHGLGTNIILGAPERRLAEPALNIDDFLFLDRAREDTAEFELQFLEILNAEGRCLTSEKKVDGFNYSKGDPVEIDILRVTPCPPVEQLTAPNSP
jgi:4-amino-4-deoxy-L-arabinose transferase-like glycosyltransferase